MLNLNEFSHNHHPSRVNLLAKYIRRGFSVLLILLMLCGCSRPQTQATQDTSPGEMVRQTETANVIPPFEKEQKEILPLPEDKAFSDDPMEFVGDLIDHYEVLHVEEIDGAFELLDMEVEKQEDGFLFSALPSDIFDTRAISFSQPLDGYFNTPENSYAVLIRFKSDNIDYLNFKLESRFGRIMLGFDQGKYPTIDLHGDSYGDPMLPEKWNSYIYTSGEWAYVFLTITEYGQKTCYLWSEDDPENFNTHTSFGRGEDGSASLFFNMELGDEGETVTISDIWLFSYERVKI